MPLYARILLWFLLNLILVALAFVVLLRAQFRLKPDLLLAGQAGERIEAIADLLLEELESRPAAQWGPVLERFGNAYRLQFTVFDNDGIQLAGSSTQLPAEVTARLAAWRGPPPPAMSVQERAPLSGPPYRGPPARERPGRGPPELRRGEGPRDQWPSRAPRPKFLVHTDNPTGYWLGVRARLKEADRQRPLFVTLVALSSSIRGAGLFFDYKPWLAVGLGAVVFSALFWFPLVRGITRSIGQMTAATRQIAAGRFEVRVDDRRRDELGSLGQSINQMAARLDGLVSGQKRFLGDVAHELCAPLAKLRTALGILEQRSPENQRTYVATASGKAEEIAGLVNELLSFSKAALGASQIRLQPVSVRALAEKAMAREAAQGATFTLEAAPEIRVQAEPELLLRAFSNLLRNAVRYAGPAGPITLSARREGGYVDIAVTDCGPGVPEPDLDRVFEPFYRVDASRDRATGGVGLGLAIVKTCVESCGGTVLCRNRPPAGLEVLIRLSAAQPGEPEPSAATHPGVHAPL